MRKNTARGLAVLAIGIGLVGAGTSPAMAGTYDGGCGVGEVCLKWEDLHTSPVADFDGDIANYIYFNFYNTGIRLNDNVAAASNGAKWTDVTLYENADYWGAERTINPGQSVTDLGVLTNQASSHYW